MKIVIVLLSFLRLISALGIIVPPIKIGDSKALSLVTNTINCISYVSSKDDIILLTLKLGDKLSGQLLNVIVIDEFGNILRQLTDISHDLNIIFSNLNSQFEHDGETINIRSNNIILNLLLGSHEDSKDSQDSKDAGSDQNEQVSDDKNSPDSDVVVDSHVSVAPKAKSFLEFNGLNDKRDVSDQLDETSRFLVCFDNIYTDKSWSFHPKNREIHLFVDIKNMTTIKHFNYRSMAKYFNRLKFEHFNSDENNEQDNDNKETSQRVDKSKTTKSGQILVPLTHAFSERDWIQEINFLKTELNNIVDNLKESEHILQDLTEQESILRDTNEEIYSNYTKIVTVLYIFICVVGLSQLIYYRWLLRKQKVLQ